MSGAIDWALVGRLWALGDLATEIDTRVLEFLADAGFDEEHDFGMKPPEVGAGLEVDLELPEG